MPHADRSKPTLSTRIEARLFSEGASITLSRMEKMLDVSRTELDEGLAALGDRLAGSGMVLVRTETEAALAVSASCSRELEESYAAELERDIGDAGLEVLSIVLYRGPSTRTEIDYIRGVNSSSTMRTLLQRGLIERTNNPKDAREYLYRPTTDLLAHLGATRAENLPEHATIVAELAAFERENSAFTHNKHDGNSGEQSEPV